MIFQAPRLDPLELNLVQRVTTLRGELKTALPTTSRWYGLLRRNLFARAIQGSNTIEGYNATFDEAVAVVEGEGFEAAEGTRSALAGYRNAMTYVLSLADDPHFVLNEELIRSLHYMMTSNDLTKHPGRWRPGPISVRREPSGERVYDGPDAERVPELVREMVADLRSSDDTAPVIVKAAMAHLNLVMIHPFSDGNGRMGRAIQTLVLARDGILHPTFSSIEEYLGSRGNTEDYYKVLTDVGAGSWHPERDARPWIRFCLWAHLMQAQTIRRRVKETAKLWDELETQTTKLGLPHRVIPALYEASLGLTVKSARYRTLADVKVQVATKDLRSLVSEGFLLPKGEKRGRHYLASPSLRAIRESIREPREEPDRILKGQLALPT